MADLRRTFGEHIELMQLQYQDAKGDVARTLMRQAIRHAYTDMPTFFDWTYFARRYLINTVEPYDTGTVSYDATSGLFTLSGGTWPAWAEEGQLWISDNRYGVAERISDTVLAVDYTQAPGDDIAATSYTLLKPYYDLPPDFWRMQGLARSNGLWPLTEAKSNTRPDFRDAMPQPGAPCEYAFVSIPSIWPGAVGLELIPAPDAAESVMMNYRARSRPWVTARPYTTGTVSITGTTVTGSGTVFPQTASGMLLRVGTSAIAPTGMDGAAPYAAQYQIAHRVSDTVLRLFEPATAVSGVKYVLDDPVDIDPLVMVPTFDLLCAEWYCQLTRKKEWTQVREQRIWSQKNAQAQDNKAAIREVFWDEVSWTSFWNVRYP